MGPFFTFLAGFIQTPAMVGAMGTPPPPPPPPSPLWFAGIAIGAAALFTILVGCRAV